LALEADTTSLDGLDLVVDILRSTHTTDKLAIYKSDSRSLAGRGQQSSHG